MYKVSNGIVYVHYLYNRNPIYYNTGHLLFSTDTECDCNRCMEIPLDVQIWKKNTNGLTNTTYWLVNTESLLIEFTPDIRQ